MLFRSVTRMQAHEQVAGRRDCRGGDCVQQTIDHDVVPRIRFGRDGGQRENASRRIQTDAPAKFLARGPGLSGEIPVELRRSGDVDRVEFVAVQFMKTARSADEATSAAAFRNGLPVSRWMISAKARSLVRSRAAARPRISPRLGGGTRLHDGAVSAAASIARATSAALPRATAATTRSSIGLRLSNVAVPTPGTSSSFSQ